MTDREYMENKVRHAFNKGYDLGFKDGKEKAKSQEPILDKIRAELIQSIQNGTLKIESGNKELFRIIDKYKGESEDKA